MLGAPVLLASASAAVADDHADARFRGTGKADPIRIENVRRSDGPAAGQSSITLDLAWDHSWRAAWEVGEKQHGGKGPLKLESWDAAWVFVKFRKPGADRYSHAMLSTERRRSPGSRRSGAGGRPDGRRQARRRGVRLPQDGRPRPERLQGRDPPLAARRGWTPPPSN